ncbi:hypothetical protein [Lelliottia wanjuensis]|uniref:hypothetical protein n=1 Tax=Lelliottia wanjuensis TaxID=3050585 RepID=UPI00254AA04D|nr:hypothetical protein [Lelliottia sp. V86_10]MDK9585870.1 hypothetical protein [Lelliottia sp. V86_10]
MMMTNNCPSFCTASKPDFQISLKNLSRKYMNYFLNGESDAHAASDFADDVLTMSEGKPVYLTLSFPSRENSNLVTLNSDGLKTTHQDFMNFFNLVDGRAEIFKFNGFSGGNWFGENGLPGYIIEADFKNKA